MRILLGLVLLNLLACTSPHVRDEANKKSETQSELKNVETSQNKVKLITLSHEKPSFEMKRDYDRAMQLKSQGKESEALLSLSDFLRRYPQSALSDEVQFQMAKIYFSKRDFETAQKEFEKVYLYQSKINAKIPATSLAIGQCLFEQKKYGEATIEWKALIRRFPKTQEASEASLWLEKIP